MDKNRPGFTITIHSKMSNEFIKIPLLLLLASFIAGCTVTFVSLTYIFKLLKIKNHVKKKLQKQNTQKKVLHNDKGRNPSLNSNPESFKNQNQNNSSL